MNNSAKDSMKIRTGRRAFRAVLAAMAFACVLGAIFAPATFAQGMQIPVQWTASAGSHPVPIRAGESFNVVATATIADGWHLYAIDQTSGGPIPTRVTIPDGQAFTLNGAVKEPPPTAKFDPNFNLETRFFEKHVEFIVPVKAAAGVSAGASVVNVDVRYQACNDKLCMPPRTVHLAAAVVIGAGATKRATAAATPSNAPAPTSATKGSAPSTTGDSGGTAENSATAPTGSAVNGASAAPPLTIATYGSFNAVSRGDLWSFVWLAMGMGALSLLTPCVFPMIPITVSFFTNHSAESRFHAVRNAILYALGIILTFTALGLGLAVVFGAGGVNQLASNPWVNLLITAIFVGFALSLFGVFFIQPPARLVEKLDGITRNAGTSGVIGILLMGLTFTLTSFTCTSPFVGTVLVMAAQGSWKWPVAGMLAFSSVFALPFFLLALTPQFARQLPKSGSWMNSVKVVMGFLEIAAAMKFISNVDLIWHWGVFTRSTVLGIWIVIAVAVAVYLTGRLPVLREHAPGRITALRAVLATAFLGIAIWLGLGFFGRPLGEIESFLPPMHRGAVASVFAGGPGAEKLDWISNNYDQAFAKARAARKPLFVNFTGYTCTNCRWMEANMFSRPDVRRDLSQFVLAELYTDGSGKLFEDQQNFQQQKFGTVALPFYVIVNDNGDTLATYAGLTRDPNEFLSFLGHGVNESARR
jgi:thiol:disulfide interchange protein DsbD